MTLISPRRCSNEFDLLTFPLLPTAAWHFFVGHRGTINSYFHDQHRTVESANSQFSGPQGDVVKKNFFLINSPKLKEVHLTLIEDQDM